MRRLPHIACLANVLQDAITPAQSRAGAIPDGASNKAIPLRLLSVTLNLSACVEKLTSAISSPQPFPPFPQALASGGIAITR